MSFFVGFVLMAYLHATGFELNSLALETTLVTNTPTVSSAVKRSGNYSMRSNGWTTGTAQRIQLRYVNTATTGPFYARAYLRIDTLPSAENRILRLSGGTVVVYVTIDHTGLLKLYDEDGNIGSGSTLAADASTWQRLELEFNATGGAGTNICKLYLNGVQDIGATNRSIVGTIHSFDVGGNQNGESQTQGDWYWDDVAVSNSALPGDDKLVHLYVDGNGDMGNAGTQVVDWDTGPTPAGTAYQMIDETPTPNDATDYLQLIVASTGSGNRELYFTLQSAASAGIGASDTINAVLVGIRVSCLTAAAATYVLGLQSQSAGTKAESAAIGIGVTTWTTHDDTGGLLQYKLISVTDPQGGGAWTPALLDSAQIGVRAPDATPDVLVTSMWALVMYVPGAAVGGGPLIGEGRLIGGSVLGGRLVA